MCVAVQREQHSTERCTVNGDPPPVNRLQTEGGFAMGALLVSLFVLSLLTALALPVWHHAAQREREAELIFRGEQYARAIALWQRQRPGSVPEDIDTLIEERFLRKRYRDPMTSDGEFRVLLQSDLARLAVEQIVGTGNTTTTLDTQDTENQDVAEQAGGVAGGIVGVVSTSTKTSIASYNGRNQYDEWVFIYSAATETDSSLGQPGLVPGQLSQGDSGVGTVPQE